MENTSLVIVKRLNEYSLMFNLYKAERSIKHELQKMCQQHIDYTFFCSLPENILSLMLASNSLTQKCIHFNRSTFTSLDRQPFVSKDILQRQQTTINTILMVLMKNAL